jgi:hypothetical protein
MTRASPRRNRQRNLFEVEDPHHQAVAISENVTSELIKVLAELLLEASSYREPSSSREGASDESQNHL